MNAHQHPLLTVMWAVMGVAFFATVAVVLFGLDSAVPGYISGGLLIACLLVCVVPYWLDDRSRVGVERIRGTDEVRDLTAAP